MQKELELGLNIRIKNDWESIKQLWKILKDSDSLRFRSQLHSERYRKTRILKDLGRLRKKKVSVQKVEE